MHQRLELFLRPRHAPFRFQLLFENITQADQVSGVHCCVGQHLCGKRTFAPIGFLEFLVQLHPEVLLQIRG